MKKQQFTATYEAPEVEIMTFAVECGFQGSIEKPGENPEGDWVLP